MVRPMIEPKKGDNVLACSHVDVQSNLHWYHMEPVEVERSDGATFTCKWIGVCDGCHRMHVAGVAFHHLLRQDFILTRDVIIPKD